MSNSEVGSSQGGASAVRFGPTGPIQKAYRVLSGTNMNCSGGATPWNRWLSGEEVELGQIYECDPSGSAAAVARPALGRFKHEAAAVDAPRRAVYLTGDEPDGCFYRFRPSAWMNLSAGTLEVACPGTTTDSSCGKPVPDPSASSTRTRYQVSGARKFNGGEGCYYDRDVCYFTTKGDNRVWGYNAVTSRLALVYDDNLVTSGTPLLRGVDGLTVSRTRDIFVREDGDDMQINMIRKEQVPTLLQVVGQSTSEIAASPSTPLATGCTSPRSAGPAAAASPTR